MNALPKPPKTLVPAMKDANNQELACGHLIETLWQEETRMVRQQSRQVENSCWSSMATKGRRKALWNAGCLKWR